MVAAMIVASGKTSFPGEFQPFKKIGNISAVQRMVLVMQRAGVDRVFLVTSESARQLEKHVSRMDTASLYNEQPNAEMIDNIRFGLRNIPGKFEKVLIAPVDSPLFSDETIQKLCATDAPFAVPAFQGKRGHPTMISAEWIDAVLEYDGDGGLKGLLAKRADIVRVIEVDDEGILHNIRRDDADWDALAERHVLGRIRPVIKLSLARDDVFYGPGAQMLMELTDETKSLRAACGRMGISYSKGWKMIVHLEQKAGFEVMTRQQGGKSGGLSELTEMGKKLVESYRNLLREQTEAAEALFKKHLFWIDDEM